MAEFIRPEEKVVNVSEPVIFENNTDSDFSVSAAIVFRKSGLYDVSITGRRIVISKVAERKKGKWISVDSYSAFGGDEAIWMAHGNPVAFYYCSECKEQAYVGEDGESLLTEFCPNCGADMKDTEK